MWHNLITLIWWLKKGNICLAKYFEKSKWCLGHILSLPCVNILVCIAVVSVVIVTHPWIRIKSPYLYYMKKYFICCLWLIITCNLLFATMFIFCCKCCLQLKFNHKRQSQTMFFLLVRGNHFVQQGMQHSLHILALPLINNMDLGRMHQCVMLRIWHNYHSLFNALNKFDIKKTLVQKLCFFNIWMQYCLGSVWV
jgi:hypothetical protein